MANFNGWVSESPLDQPDIGTVQPSPMGQSLLRESPSEALAFHDSGEGG